MAGITSSTPGFARASEEARGKAITLEAMVSGSSSCESEKLPASAPRRQALPCQCLNPTSELIDLFIPLGGVAREHEMLETLRAVGLQPISKLARWIVERHVCHFSWQASIYLPRFQFDTPDAGLVKHVPLPGMKMVLAELHDQFDDLEVARWFATPNVWLNAELPARLLLSDAHLVVQAARADRNIAKGW